MKKPFNRIITVMFENQYRNYVIQDPFLKKLASAGADMTNYFGVFHPSQTNYLASFAGEVCGITNDTPPASPLMQQTLVDLLEAKNISWKAYMEAYPSDPWNSAWTDPNYPASEQPINEYPNSGGVDLARYFRKHNAFASFHTIQNDENRWNKIVSDVQFWEDVQASTLPEYSWFTPDIWNDGHYLYNTHIDTNPRTQLVPQVSTWLEHIFLGNIDASQVQGGADTGLDKMGLNLDVDLLLIDPQKAWQQSNVPEGTLIVVTFDEADFDAVGYDTNYDGPNQIYTVLLGDMITPGTVVSTPYNHYNLIRTVEENFQLGSLNKNDHGANWFRFLWEEAFFWDRPNDTTFPAGNALAVAQWNKTSHLVFTDSQGSLYDSLITPESHFSSPVPLNFSTMGRLAMTTIEDTTVLVFESSGGELMMATYDNISAAWASPCSIGQSTSGYFALTSYFDIAATENKLMLCWATENGFIQSMEGNSNGFSGNVVPVNQLTDGPMTIGQLGGSLFLVYKERNARTMRMTSFNVAPFNSFEALDFQDNPDPVNNTTLHQWTVTDFPVGNFAKKMAALANEYENLGNMAMATAAGEMHLVHRGGYPDLSNAYTEVFGLTGIYSSANQYSNGFGTLDQAGWTKETEMSEVSIDINSPLAMCSNGEELIMAWADSKSSTIKYRRGKYSEL